MESDLVRRNLFSLAALVMLALFAAGSVDSNTSQSSSKTSPSSWTTQSTPSSETTPSRTPTHETVHIGEIGMLSAGGSSTVIVGSDKAAEDELTNAAVKHDQEGFVNLMLSGRAFAVPSGTKVRMLDTIFTLDILPTGAHVRILEGEFHGRDGYVPHEWVVPATSSGPTTSETATPEIRKALPVGSASPKRKQQAKP
jgi:hypothetical protein